MSLLSPTLDDHRKRSSPARPSAATASRTSWARLRGTTSTASPDCTTTRSSTPTSAIDAARIGDRDVAARVDRDHVADRDVAVVAGRRDLGQRRPGADVVPAEVAGHADDVGQVLEHAVIDRDGGQGRVALGRRRVRRRVAARERAPIAASAPCVSGRWRSMSASSRSARTKHIPVFHRYPPPATIAAAAVADGFSTKRRTARAPRRRSARPAPGSRSRSRAGSGARRWRPRCAALLGQRERARGRGGEGVVVGDVVIRGQDGHHRVRVARHQMRRGQPDGRGGVAPDRLAQHLDRAQLRRQRPGLVGRDDRDRAVGGTRRAPAGGGQQRLAAARQAQELLGMRAPARRPQPGAAAARQDHAVAHGCMVAARAAPAAGRRKREAPGVAARRLDSRADVPWTGRRGGGVKVPVTALKPTPSEMASLPSTSRIQVEVRVADG